MDERSILEQVLAVLKSGGAEGDAFLEERRTLSIQVREGRVEELSRADVRGLAVRAMRGGRLGFVHTSHVEPDGIRAAAEKALALSDAASQREDLVIPDPAGPGDGRDEGADLGLYDATIERRSIHDKQDWARTVEAVARGVDPKIRKTEGAVYTENLAGYWIANTRGLFRYTRKSRLQASVQVVAEEAGELQVGEVGVEATRWDDLPDPGALGRRAGERALKLFGGRPVATGRYPVVFGPDAGFAVLVHLALALRGDSLSQKRSWLSGRGGAVIGSPAITIHDDGHRPKGIGSLPFDAEGVDTRNLILVDRGKVCGELLDLASAKSLGQKSTGSARREGYEQLPQIAASNLYLVPGEAKVEDLLAKIEDGLWVWGLSGWWIGLDPSNPQFSSAAFGLWIKNGKPAQPVARVTVAGSIEEILVGTEEIADDLVMDRPTKTPTFRVREMSVSGT